MWVLGDWAKKLKLKFILANIRHFDFNPYWVCAKKLLATTQPLLKFFAACRKYFLAQIQPVMQKAGKCSQILVYAESELKLISHMLSVR